MMDFRDRNCLIVYFSHAGKNYVSGNIVNLLVGNTQRAAMMVQKFTRGSIHRIHTVRPYPDDYKETVAIARKELREDARPVLANKVEDMSKYDVVFLGYPNWCSTMPMAVWTFLEAYDFSDKTIVPFCTHEGSGFGHSLEDIHRLCPKATLGKGLALLGTTIEDAEDDIRRWINE